MKTSELAEAFLESLVTQSYALIESLKSSTDPYAEYNKSQLWYEQRNDKSLSFCMNIKAQANVNKKIEVNKKTQRLFVFLDEANSLLENSEVLENGIALKKYKIMRRACRKLFSKFDVLFVLAGTNSDLAEFVSNNTTMSVSERESNLDLNDPFYQILFTDELIPEKYLSSIRSDHLYEAVSNRDPFESLFYYGRPLWGAFLNACEPLVRNNKEILLLAQQKIIFNSNWNEIKPDDKYLAALAVLSSRTTLCVNYEVFEGTKLIAQHMSTLFFIDKKRTNCAFKYLSEPILAAGKFSITILN